MRKILGILLIILGTLLILGYMYKWSFELWPFSLLILGIFLFLASSKIRYMLYIPATILTLSSIFFIYNVFTGWHNFDKLWPILMLIVSISFFIPIIISKKNEFLSPAFIILGISICLFFISFNVVNFWPIIFIILGLWLLIDKRIFGK